jgi:hypothetical protein
MPFFAGQAGAYAKLVQRQQMDKSQTTGAAAAERADDAGHAVVEEADAPAADIEDVELQAVEPVPPVVSADDTIAPDPAKAAAGSAAAEPELSEEEKQAEEEKKKAEAAKIKAAEDKLFSSAEGSLKPMLRGGIAAAFIVGGQFPAFNFIIAEMILVLTHCAEINWCDWPEMKELLDAANDTSCPTTWGLQEPLFTDKATCVLELEENAQVLVWVRTAVLCTAAPPANAAQRSAVQRDTAVAPTLKNLAPNN